MELIRKKQDELHVALLRMDGRRFLAYSQVGKRLIPVELAIGGDVLMMLVPRTDAFISSFDFEQLRNVSNSDDMITLVRGRLH